MANTHTHTLARDKSDKRSLFNSSAITIRMRIQPRLNVNFMQMCCQPTVFPPLCI